MTGAKASEIVGRRSLKFAKDKPSTTSLPRRVRGHSILCGGACSLSVRRTAFCLDAPKDGRSSNLGD